ncbi:MAG TPA: hypothetical protein VFQ58_00025 [Flavisolibacter sp.]|jgi:hypothetical protein|nr:hypothetical protein [Flavisolibacter sp.]
MAIQFMRHLLIPTAFFLLIGNLATSQSLEGRWKGTSICQIKNSPCHDEKVIYHISKKSEDNSYQIIANKIVEGKEDNMGTLIFSYDEKQSMLYLIDKDQDVKWQFKVTGNEMHGTLTSRGKLFRVVDLKKED